jgi:hypothetical protein
VIAPNRIALLNHKSGEAKNLAAFFVFSIRVKLAWASLAG